nr:JAB-like toxin 1 domain-containing protein [Chryseobacterium balustinum]
MATTSNRTDALDVFQFAALNSTNEWSIASNTSDGKAQYALGTRLHPTLSPNYLAFDKLGFSSKTMNWDMHSHGHENGTNGPSSGDKAHALSMQITIQAGTRKTASNAFKAGQNSKSVNKK